MKKNLIQLYLVLSMVGVNACEPDPIGVPNDGTDETPISQNTDQDNSDLDNTDVDPTPCPEGFTGDQCQDCVDGYYGENCDPCRCVHGNCIDQKEGDGSCECDVGYRGDFCAIECMGGANNPCSGHGACNDDGSCTCEGDIKGADCSGCEGNTTNYPDCDQCVTGYFGHSCLQECPGLKEELGICSGHGKCDEGPTGTGKCTCDDGFTGENCDQCDEGYKGYNCQFKCPGVGTALGICSAHGTCDELGTCTCDENWEGNDCSQLRTSCHFGYDFQYDSKVVTPTVISERLHLALTTLPASIPMEVISSDEADIQAISNAIELTELIDESAGYDTVGGASYTIVYPWAADTSLKDLSSIGLFKRAQDWGSGKRCFEIPDGDSTIARDLTESQAYDIYKDIAEKATGRFMNETANRRNLVGIRGAYPGTFTYHGNYPDRYNDSIILIWKDASEKKHVLEFPANTDFGAYTFTKETSSALLANRHYRFINGKHQGKYDAMRMNEWGYASWFDANDNGYLDSVRNGTYPGYNGKSGTDKLITGNDGHNLHYARLDESGKTLFTAKVGIQSAGCHGIPGQENWKKFIDNAWTATKAGTDNATDNTVVDYFLVDARDIDKRVWNNCSPDGTHSCPYVISFDSSGKYKFSGDTAASGRDNKFDKYYCSNAVDQSGGSIYVAKGNEEVYVFTYDGNNTNTKIVTVTVTPKSGAAVGVNLLYSDDPLACIAHGDQTISQKVYPGRYVIVVDSKTDESGTGAKPGSYDLEVSIK